jgi:hypothetical protein
MRSRLPQTSRTPILPVKSRRHSTRGQRRERSPTRSLGSARKLLQASCGLGSHKNVRNRKRPDWGRQPRRDDCSGQSGKGQGRISRSRRRARLVDGWLSPLGVRPTRPSDAPAASAIRAAFGQPPRPANARAFRVWSSDDIAHAPPTVSMNDGVGARPTCAARGCCLASCRDVLSLRLWPLRA